MEGKMVDRYTKIVLTIIAACLTIIAARDLPFFNVASAQAPAHVIVDQFSQSAFNYAFQHVFVPLPVTIER
jgi:hypothetical protein